ncbi:MAG TPA: hypothetical protein VNL69_07240 [Bacteroidota bacterium]|nr:hypothetical protein [Bacteroidota bacterium]
MNRLHWAGLAGIVGMSLVAEWLTPHAPDHATHWWSGVPGFYAIFGFLGCIAIILLAKMIGKLFLLKNEDSYDAD